jgi:hypothetical protein
MGKLRQMTETRTGSSQTNRPWIEGNEVVVRFVVMASGKESRCSGFAWRGAERERGSACEIDL